MPRAGVIGLAGDESRLRMTTRGDSRLKATTRGEGFVAALGHKARL